MAISSHCSLKDCAANVMATALVHSLNRNLELGHNDRHIHKRYK